MPQITSTRPGDLKQPEKRIPSGTSRSSNTVRTALSSILRLLFAGGVPGEPLHQVTFPAIEDFYGDSPGAFALERDTQDDIHTEILPALMEIRDLAKWPAGWNGYNALAPGYSAIQYAEHWIELFYTEILDLGMIWLEPNVTASAEGEVVFEWRHSINRLTIYIGKQSAEYVKDWGADINTEMEDGLANSTAIRQALWNWLMS